MISNEFVDYKISIEVINDSMCINLFIFIEPNFKMEKFTKVDP